MILKELYLQPDMGDYPVEIYSQFGYQSRSICNFLEREIKSPKVVVDDFRRICFIGKSSPNPKGIINSCNVLRVEIKFDENEYLALKEDELNPYFSQLLKVGFAKCREQFNIPYDRLMAGLEKFRCGGYKNEWCFKTRQFKSLGIKCSLNCQLTMSEFRLTLKIIKVKAKEIIYEQQILETKPDEIFFEGELRDIVLDENKLIVINKLDKPIFELSTDELNI